MAVRNSKIDGGKAFDRGKTSMDYAKFRDVYPQEFYQKIINRGLCINGQKVFDILHYGAIAELKVIAP